MHTDSATQVGRLQYIQLYKHIKFMSFYLLTADLEVQNANLQKCKFQFASYNGLLRNIQQKRQYKQF